MGRTTGDLNSIVNAKMYPNTNREPLRFKKIKQTPVTMAMGSIFVHYNILRVHTHTYCRTHPLTYTTKPNWARHLHLSAQRLTHNQIFHCLYPQYVCVGSRYVRTYVHADGCLYPFHTQKGHNHPCLLRLPSPRAESP